MKFQKKSRFTNAQDFVKLRRLLKLIRKGDLETLKRIDEIYQKRIGKDWLEKN